MDFILSPSILSADFGHLESDIAMLNNSEADWIHVDVMDGVFVPNISFGFPVMNMLKKTAQKPLDVHVMITQPDQYINHFAEQATSTLSVHYEACTHLHRTLNEIRNKGMKAGVALNPHTPVNLLEDIITEADMILVLSVNPGFGGQKFIEHSYQKIEKLKNLIIQKNSNAKIEVDGGVTLDNAAKLSKAGADILVAGNAVFNSAKPIETIRQFKAI
ncbi:MAG: ribulose-phosphate 3-epimerase [Bacteroidetes bacterium]|nr:ribulose-phosphate 3-epimerase [Bacteroidota bacterium]